MRRPCRHPPFVVEGRTGTVRQTVRVSIAALSFLLIMTSTRDHETSPRASVISTDWRHDPRNNLPSTTLKRVMSQLFYLSYVDD
jgi:hypothetical protein